jgi:hypothetical protein
LGIFSSPGSLEIALHKLPQSRDGPFPACLKIPRLMPMETVRHLRRIHA